MNPSVKNKIKTIRELRNYTQEYMAYQLGITQAGYSKIEKGKTTLSYVKLEEISRILEVSIEDIISFDSQRYFKGLHTPNYNNNINSHTSCNVLKGLYEDKIKLLEKLLNKTESELDHYKNRYGPH
ncbi:helix-turn-helix domain-containing protein [Flavobacterium sp. LC2016-23]|uniref:helix-turn-helix transcriptional regulator n=1 Tax=Flavobacterium sp. LC2016-23 TaxID=2666330 RepID=UPI0012AF8398|nr:helix-turn-helix transcriptional regulator [Flavobacterium sp. LC2016-23]MRX41533.1 helix-turn-helix domain-containing protein [Flavobacterium sp. LC2016-23]